MESLEGARNSLSSRVGTGRRFFSPSEDAEHALSPLFSSPPLSPLRFPWSPIFQEPPRYFFLDMCSRSLDDDLAIQRGKSSQGLKKLSLLSFFHVPLPFSVYRSWGVTTTYEIPFLLRSARSRVKYLFLGPPSLFFFYPSPPSSPSLM